MSWLDKDGFRRVSLKTLSLYTGLSEKTVSKMLKGLVEKMIINRKHTTSVDMFMIRELQENPFILLSEAIHHWFTAIVRDCTSIRNSKREIEHMIHYAYDDTPIAIRFNPSKFELFSLNLAASYTCLLLQLLGSLGRDKSSVKEYA